MSDSTRNDDGTLKPPPFEQFGHLNSYMYGHGFEIPYDFADGGDKKISNKDIKWIMKPKNVKKVYKFKK